MQQRVHILCETGGHDRWICVGDTREAAEQEYTDAILLRDFPRPLYRVIVRAKH